LAKVNEFLDNYVYFYVKFTSSANDNIAGNLSDLRKYMVPGSELEKRMKGGVDGLFWASSRGDTLKNIEVHDCMNIGGGNFVCDITFTVDTVGWNGHVETNNNAKILITTTNSGLKAAAMKNY